MTRLRTIFYATLALAAGAFPGIAAAQTPAQTQEGAVRFLDLFAAQQQPPIASSTSFDKLDVNSRLRMPVPPTRWVKVTKFDSERPCDVDLKDSGGKYSMIDWGEARVFYHTRADWSEAMLASDFGPLIKPMIEIRSKASSSYVIWPATEEEGARLFRAMQFLAESCDPLKATGF